MNLLKETLECLEDNKKTPEDVLWVGSMDGDYSVSWKEFVEMSKEFEYNAVFGVQELVVDLVVVGKDWWLERDGYMADENWVFKTIPKQVKKPKKFKEIGQNKRIMWKSIEDLNE